jgi:hypothetical protein
MCWEQWRRQLYVLPPVLQKIIIKN